MKRKIKIFLVEDDKFLMSMYSQKFLAEGFIIQGAASAEEAWPEIKAFKPGLILLDIMLPGQDGLSLLRSLKREPSLAPIPVVLMTNLSRPSDREQGLMLGAADYLVKAHFLPSEIVDKVKQILA
ncbi:MAG: response regulator [Patescibacteria group bacterium]|nr:MAG: response regulator [Patescibacteria group bacterium]